MPQSEKTVGTSVRIIDQLAILLNKLLLRANRKYFGRKIAVGEDVGEAMALIKDHHIAGLQESSRTQEEKLAILYERYSRTETISKDQFLDKLMTGDIPKGVLKALLADRAKLSQDTETTNRKQNSSKRSTML